MALSAGEVEGVLRFRSEMAQRLEEAERSLGRFEGRLKQAGTAIRNAGAALLPLSAGVTAVGVASIKFGAEFEAVMGRVANLTDLGVENIEEVTAAVFEISKAVGTGPIALARGLEVVASTGLDAETSMRVLEQAAKASAVGLGETRDIARAVTAAITAYGAENLSAADATDKLFVAVRAGGAEADEFAGTLGRVVGIASQVGVSFDEVLASVATFTRLGVDASEAVTALRGTMSVLLRPTEQTENALVAVGSSLDNLRKAVRERGLAAALLELFELAQDDSDAIAAIVPNVRALASVMGTAGSQAMAYAETLDDVRNAAGDIDTAFERTAETINRRWGDALAQTERIMIGVFTVFKAQILTAIDAIQPMIDATERWVESLARADPAVRNFAGAVGAIAAVIAPVLISLGSFVRVLGFAVGGLRPFVALLAPLAGLLRAVTGPIGLVVTSLLTLVTSTETGRRALADFGAFLATQVSRQIERWIDGWNRVIRVLQVAIDWVRNIGQAVAETFGPRIVQSVEAWTRIWERVREVFARVWAETEVLRRIVVAFVQVLAGSARQAIANWVNLWQDTINVLQVAIRWISDVIDSAGAFGRLVTVGQLGQSMETWIRLWRAVFDVIQDVVVWLDRVTGASSRFSGFLDRLAGNLEFIADRFDETRGHLRDLEREFRTMAAAGGFTESQLRELAARAEEFRAKGLRLSPELQRVVDHVDRLGTQAKLTAGDLQRPLATSIDDLFEHLKDLGDGAVDGGKSLETLGSSAATGAVGISALRDEVQALVDEISGADLERQVEDLTRAWNALTDEQRGQTDVLLRTGRLVENLASQHARLSPELQSVLTRFQALQGEMQRAELDAQRLSGSIEDLFDHLNALQGLTVVLPSTPIEGLTALMLGYTEAIDGATAALDRHRKGFERPPSTTFFEDIARQAAKTLDTVFDELPDIIVGAIQGGGDVGRSIGAFVGGQFAEGFGEIVKERLGGRLGSLLGGFLGPLGAIGGSLLGSLFDKLFGGPSDAEIQGRALSNQFIDAFIREAEVSSDRIAAAVAQGWDERLAEFALSVQDIFVQSGRSAEEGLAAVQRLFDSIAEGPEATQAAIDAIQRIADETRELEQATTDLTTALADRQALFAEVLDQGVDAFRRFRDSGIAAGVEVPEAFRAMLEAAQLLEGEITGPLIQGAQAGAEALQSLNTLGEVSGKNFAQFGAAIGRAFDRLIQGGATSEAALEAMRQPLAVLIRLQEQHGFTVDASTQAILDQAREYGITAAEGVSAAELQLEALNKVIAALELIIARLGGATDAAETLGKVDPTVSIGVDTKPVEDAADRVPGLVEHVEPIVTVTADTEPALMAIGEIEGAAAGVQPIVRVAGDVSPAADDVLRVTGIAEGTRPIVTIDADITPARDAIRTVDDVARQVKPVITVDGAVDPAVDTIRRLPGLADDVQPVVTVTADVALATQTMASMIALAQEIHPTLTIGADLGPVEAALDRVPGLVSQTSSTVTVTGDTSDLSASVDEATGAASRAAAVVTIGADLSPVSAALGAIPAAAETTTALITFQPDTSPVAEAIDAVPAMVQAAQPVVTVTADLLPVDDALSTLPSRAAGIVPIVTVNADLSPVSAALDVAVDLATLTSATMSVDADILEAQLAIASLPGLASDLDPVVVIRSDVSDVTQSLGQIPTDIEVPVRFATGAFETSEVAAFTTAAALAFDTLTLGAQEGEAALEALRRPFEGVIDLQGDLKLAIDAASAELASQATAYGTTTEASRVATEQQLAHLAQVIAEFERAIETAEAIGETDPVVIVSADTTAVGDALRSIPSSITVPVLFKAGSVPQIRTRGFQAGTPRLDFADFGLAETIEAHGREAIIPEARASLLGAEVARALETGTSSHRLAGEIAAVVKPRVLRQTIDVAAIDETLDVAIREATKRRPTGPQGFQRGTPDLDFHDFGPRSLIEAHGQEAIVPRGGGHQLAGEIAEALAPLLAERPSVSGGDGVTLVIHDGAIRVQGADEATGRRILAGLADALQRGGRETTQLMGAIRAQGRGR